jgi:hypothetical protein
VIKPLSLDFVTTAITVFFVIPNCLPIVSALFSKFQSLTISSFLSLIRQSPLLRACPAFFEDALPQKIARHVEKVPAVAFAFPNRPALLIELSFNKHALNNCKATEPFTDLIFNR